MSDAQRASEDRNEIYRTRTKLIYPGEAYSSSNKFNCHGYAWNMHEGGPMRWVGWRSQTVDGIFGISASHVPVAAFLILLKNP